VTHPDWCTNACDAGREGGKHRGASIHVRNARGPIASVWLEQVPGGPERIGFTAGFHAVAWTAKEAKEVSEAIRRVAGVAVGERVG
jgi:hypothetical protein